MFLKAIFADKLIDDNRVDHPLFTFDAPGFKDARCCFLPPNFAFYYQLVVVGVFCKSSFQLNAIPF